MSTASDGFAQLLDAVRRELESTAPELDTVVRLRCLDAQRCVVDGYALSAGFPAGFHSEVFDRDEIALAGAELLAYAWVDAFLESPVRWRSVDQYDTIRATVTTHATTSSDAGHRATQ